MHMGNRWIPTCTVASDLDCLLFFFCANLAIFWCFLLLFRLRFPHLPLIIVFLAWPLGFLKASEVFVVLWFKIFICPLSIVSFFNLFLSGSCLCLFISLHYWIDDVLVKVNSLCIKVNLAETSIAERMEQQQKRSNEFMLHQFQVWHQLKCEVSLVLKETVSIGCM